MSFLAPWALALGAAAAAALVLLHLVARHRPASFLLPTARFIPDQQSLVSRAASRPRDLLLLLLRLLLVLCAATAFARPVVTGGRARVARIVLLDRSSLVADPAGAWRVARSLSSARMPTLLAGFDSAASVIVDSARAGVAGPASLSAALVLARRSADSLARLADAVELVVVSPVAASEIDAATWRVRDQWPGSIRVERVALRADTLVPTSIERAVPLADALGPALVRVPVGAGGRAVRVLRGGRIAAADSAFALGGGTVIAWDSAAAPLAAQGLALGDDVIVAPLGRSGGPAPGRVVARWADGAPAATEARAGRGCIRTVLVSVPPNGDLPLRPAFQRIVRGLVSACAADAPSPPADSATLARLAGHGAAASSRDLAGGDAPPSRLVSWLLGAALACALLELVLRARPPRAGVGA